MVLNCLNSLSGVGISLDAEKEGKECTRLQIKYFQKLVKSEEENSKSLETKINAVSVSTKL